MISPSPNSTDEAVERVARTIFETTYREAKPQAPVPTDAEWADAWSDMQLRKNMSAVARAAISAHLAALGESGYVVVPKVPTKAMVESGLIACEDNMDSTADSYDSWEFPVATTVSATWSAMIGAALAAVTPQEKG